MQAQPQNPDDRLIVVFHNKSVRDEAATAKAGRPIHIDREECEIRVPGSRDTQWHLAHEMSAHGWVTDPLTGNQKQITYAERFPRQYKQFKAREAQTAVGTPLAYAPFLTEARRAELQALNIYTLEALAHIDGQELKNLGLGGRELKNQAEEFISASARGAASHQLVQQHDADVARMQAMEEDIRVLQERLRAAVDQKVPDQFADMNEQQLRDYITAQTGRTPIGALPLKVLQRMAAEHTSRPLE